MAERKLPMGAKEIVASYRTARNPKAQIGVLADLNGCSQKESEEVLIQLGAMKPTERKKPNPRKIDVDTAAARELLEQGMTDEEAHQEASRCLRCDHFGFGSFKGGRNTEW